MKILKIYPEKDHTKRYNYHINYGVWDEIKGDRVILEKFDGNVDNYDMVFLPMFSRWELHNQLLNKIKNSKIKKILFDNDSCYRKFTDPFYEGFDFIFYRDLDKTRMRPNINSSRLLWSIDPEKYMPVYGGKGVTFNCTIGKTYKLRKEIAKIIKPINFSGNKYIENLQRHAGAIHTNSKILPMVRAKILEFASCGTQIISNPSDYMNLYFPDELIVYFNNINELQKIVKNFKPNIKIQKKLREIVVEKHNNKLRAKYVIDKLKSL